MLTIRDFRHTRAWQLILIS